MKRPLAVFAGLLMLSFYAAVSAYMQFRSGRPSEYLMAGYRGAAIWIGIGVLLYLFPRVMRWPVGLLLIFTALALSRSSLIALVICSLSFAVGLWLFIARIPRKPSPPITPNA